MILGIDPGFHIIGWGVLQPSTFSYVESNVIKIPQNKITKDKNKTYQFHYESIREIIQSYPISHICVENNFYGHLKGLQQLIIIYGYVLLLANQFGIPFSSYMPREIRKAIFSKGNGTKEEVKNFLLTYFKKEKFNTDLLDESDALACALTYKYLSLK